MAADQPKKRLNDEIDSAIDNLFDARANREEEKSVPAKASLAKTEQPEPKPTKANQDFPDLPQEFSEFDKKLMALVWDLSPHNIEETKYSLKKIQAIIPASKKTSLAITFSLIDQILEMMIAAPRSVPISAPKTIEEGMLTIKTAYKAGKQVPIEQALAAPNPTTLPSSAANISRPNIARDRGELLQTVKKSPAGPSKEVSEAQKQAGNLAQEKKSLSQEVSLPPKAGLAPPQGLAETVKGHIMLLDKLITKRIVPIKKVFETKPGYEKLCAVHAELHKHLEQQKQTLSKALGSAPNQRYSECPFKNLSLGYWNGKQVAFITAQVAYEGIPAKTSDSAFFPLKNLKNGFLDKISSIVYGDLALLDESDLKNMQVPVVQAKDRAANDSLNNLLILFKKNFGQAFFLETMTENFETTPDMRWIPGNDPCSLVAGRLVTANKTIPVITVRSL